MKLVCFGLLACMSVTVAHAQGTAHGSCGTEPQAPKISVNTVAQYNAGIDAVQAYEKAARSYNACVDHHAQAEESDVSQAAKTKIDQIQAEREAVRTRIATNFKALSANLAGAAHKLGGH